MPYHWAARARASARALREIGVAPMRVAATPTTDGVIASLRAEPLRMWVGVQLYKETNPPLTDFLREAGARVSTVPPSAYARAADSAASRT